MSENAVNLYFKNLLNTGNSGSPQVINGATCEAHVYSILPPIATPAPDGKLYVYVRPERIIKDHPEYSGPQGYRRNHYAPYAFYIWRVANPTEAEQEAWPQYTGAFKSFLTTLGGNIPIVDPNTDIGSYLTHMGETITEQPFPAPFISTMRSIVLTRKISVDLWERVLASDG